jgi:aldehyde dehydrogenase (NAD+)
MPGAAFVHPEPRGISLILAPWNYPVQMILSPLVAALAAGNTAVLKPSELAPAASAALAKLVADVFDPRVAVVVEGDARVAQALLEQPIDFIFFTGGTGIGRKVAEAAARRLIPCVLELGGKSPVIVAADADIDGTARRVAWGKFINAGQTCIAPDYALVERSVMPAFVEGLKRHIAAFYGEDPRRSPDYGRIINDRHLSRLSGYLSDGRVVHGGQADPAGRYGKAEAPLLAETLNDEQRRGTMPRAIRSTGRTGLQAL